MMTIAGETQDQTIARLESDVAALEGDLKRAETARDEAKEMRDNLQQECNRQQEELNFLREQIAELALQIASPSAPSHKSDMARLLEGILAKDDWRNGAWRRKHSRTRPAKGAHMDQFIKYRRTQIAEMRPYEAGEVLDERISISATDRENGSPKPGDMIARNPKNHDDQWLVAAKYFAENFEPI